MDTPSRDSDHVADAIDSLETPDGLSQQLLDESTQYIEEFEQLLNESIQGRPFIEEEFEQRMDGHVKALKDFLATKRPSLSVPCSKESCRESVSKVRLLFDGFLKEKVLPQQRQLHDELKSFLADFRQLNGRVQSLFPVLQEMGDIKRSFKQKNHDRERVLMCQYWLSRLEELMVTVERDLATDYEVTLLSELKEMISDQTEEFQSWFWVDMGLSKHLEKRVIDRPRVVLSDYSETNEKIAKAQKKTETSENSLVWPLEIQSMIYALVDDLETFVDLRQVNSAWYTQFQHSEETLERFMKERNPWIQPGDGDLSSWHDCALVFVTRLKRWASVTSLEEIKVPEKAVTPTKTILAMALDPDERLPENFTPLIRHDAYCRWTACEHYHGLDGEADLLDPRDYSLLFADANFRLQFHASFSSEEDTAASELHIYSFKNRRFFLPGDFPVAERSGGVLGSHTITVKGEEDQRMVVPLIVPPIEYGADSFREGIWYESRDDDSNDVEVGGLFFRRETNAFLVADFVHTELVHYAPTTRSFDDLPAAAYNGLVWWQMHKCASLVPTFIDLQSPGKIYYREERIMRGSRMDLCQQGSEAFDASRFVVGLVEKRGVGLVKKRMVLYDLSTGTRTIVATAGYLKEGVARFFPGFVNGEFQPRFLTSDAERRMEQVVWE